MPHPLRGVCRLTLLPRVWSFALDLGHLPSSIQSLRACTFRGGLHPSPFPRPSLVALLPTSQHRKTVCKRLLIHTILTTASSVIRHGPAHRHTLSQLSAGLDISAVGGSPIFVSSTLNVAVRSSANGNNAALGIERWTNDNDPDDPAAKYQISKGTYQQNEDRTSVTPGCSPRER